MSRFFIIFLLLIALPLQSEEVDITVNANDAEVLAHFDDESELFIFRGIPYAKPPVGNLRWKSPVPVERKTQIDARSFKPGCMQDTYTTEWYHDVIDSFGQDKSLFQHIENVSEDCLYLNIWTSSVNKNEKKPVMVWVHGGADTGGWSYEPDYLGHHLAKKDVVVVSIGYRLNVFGFFKHPEMTEETGNFGLEDEILALKWIKENIADFGGDPSNVTYFGESAGGAHVSYLATSPEAKGLFKRGIIQSGGYNLFNWRSIDEAHELAIRTQSISGTIDLNDLKSLDENALLQASRNLYHPYRPIIDGKIITDNLAKKYIEGSINDVDLMIGSNKNEDLLYVEENPTLESFTKSIADYYPEQVGEILELLDTTDLRLAMDHFGSNQQTTCPSVLIARSMAKTGNHVYQYFFTREREGSEKILAYHGAEIPYVFNTHDAYLPTNEDDLKLTDQMMEYWTQFAKKGTPNSIENPITWYEFGENENYLILDIEIENGQRLESAFCNIMIEELAQRSQSE